MRTEYELKLAEMDQKIKDDTLIQKMEQQYQSQLTRMQTDLD